MELDCYVLGSDVASISEAAQRLEAAGHGGMWSVEAQHDPFLPLVIAAASTSRMRLGTNVAVAFARSPMTVAHVARDLHRLSNGRFILGLGPQVRAHIERRFAMPWSRPAARMREFVLALRAIWTAWETGDRLRFEGEFYRHTVMGPNFDPGPTGYGPPPVYLGAVGPLMTAVAGQLADGLLCHPLTTPAYLSDVALPALRSPGPGLQCPVVVSVLAATGADEAAVVASMDNVRRKIAFYAATAAYRPMLDVHGLGDLQPELNDLARQGRWDQMAGLVDDAMVERFAVVGPPKDIGRAVRERFAGLADRVSIYELDAAGRLLLNGRYLAEPEPLQELMAGFGEEGCEDCWWTTFAPCSTLRRSGHWSAIGSRGGTGVTSKQSWLHCRGRRVRLPVCRALDRRPWHNLYPRLSGPARLLGAPLGGFVASWTPVLGCTPVVSWTSSVV